MIINHNMMAMNTHRQLGMNNVAGQKSIEKLSSGFRINRAGDDAAGLAISEKMRGQIRGLNQASRNAQDGISLIQTAEGALNETHAILQRMRELAVQSATDTNTASDRTKIQAEVDELAKEITRISNTTEFNTQNLMAGGLKNTFHVGANAQQNVKLSIGAMDAQTLGVAASSISSNITPADGITGISNVTENLGTSAIIVVDNNVAAAATAAAGAIVGSVSTSGTYTGAVSATYDIEILEVTGTGADTEASKISFNGSEITGTGSFDLGNGITIAIGKADGLEAGQKGTVTLTAESWDISLANDAGILGSAATVTNNGATSVTVGNSGTGQTGTVSFTFSALSANAGIAITQVETGSTAATIDAVGNVVNNAVVQKGINVSTQTSADKAITTINNALEKVSEERSKLGAMQNRLEHTIKNLDTSAENLQASESRIRDVDMAKEMMEFTKQNILQQAATAMLAQANMAPQAVLQLLR